MQQITTQLAQILLIGITCRTSNAEILTSEPSTNIIAATIQKYFYTELFNHIPNRKAPGTTYCAYTEYENDVNGKYTFIIGEEVTSLEKIPEGLVTIAIPAQKYAKFTSGPDKMPNVCINTWQHIWRLDNTSLGGDRSYIADFELYDARAMDQQNTILDIFVGIK